MVFLIRNDGGKEEIIRKRGKIRARSSLTGNGGEERDEKASKERKKGKKIP